MLERSLMDIVKSVSSDVSERENDNNLLRRVWGKGRGGNSFSFPLLMYICFGNMLLFI